MRSLLNCVEYSSNVSIGLAAALTIPIPGYSDTFAAIPLVLGGLTVGMSHGAADWFLIRRSSSNSRFHIWGRLIAYMTIMAAMVAWWLIHSASVLVAFLLLTMVHFGSEEADHWHTREPLLNKRRSRLLFVFGHGLLAIILPVLWHPSESEAFLSRVLAVGFSDPAVAYGLIPDSIAIRCAVTIAAVACCLWIFYELVGVRTGSPKRDGLRLSGMAGRLFEWRRPANWTAQTAVLAIAGYLLNPEFFIGLYLLVWHAPRHYLNLIHSSLRERSVLWRDTMVFQIPAVAVVIVLAWTGFQSSDLTALTATSAAVVLTYLVVTPPHHLLQESRRLRQASSTKRVARYRSWKNRPFSSSS